MAKKKLTLEEKLEEAIVKDVPYEVPGNWVWTKLNVVCDVRDGTHDSPTYVNEGVPLITSKNLKNGKISFENINYISVEDHELISKRSKVDKGDILFAMIGTIGNPVLITDMSMDFSIKNVALFKSKNIISDKFMYYYVQSFMYMKQLENNLKGSTQKFIALGKLRESNVTLPPLKEQQRIVDKIESLFEKLDKAKELIEEARDDFEKRKSAVLEKAFRGELTKEWRNNNFVDYNSTWNKKKFSDIAKVKSNLVQPQEFLKYPHIAPDNIEKKTGKLLNYRTVEEDNVKSPKHRFYPGQIIYSKIRPYLSKVIIVDFEGLCSADMYPIETNLDTKYLYYYMLSDTFVDLASNSGSRSVLPKINQKELGKINVPVCSINEQKEIVRILDNLLEKESKIEELTALENQIELIKKSILAKAFRGQLGTNCEEDESALELLKEILREE